MKTCLNCIYVKKKWFEIPCRTCIENDIRNNWIGVDEEESGRKNKPDCRKKGDK